MEKSTTFAGALRVCLAATAVLFGGSSAAHAGALASASLTIEPGLGALIFPAVGATGAATSSTNATLGAGGAFAGTQTFTTPLSTLEPLDKVRVILGGNAAGSFTGATPGAVGGSAGFTLEAVYYATKSIPTPFMKVPIKVGKATTFSGVLLPGLGFTTWGNPWPAGVASTSLTTIMVTMTVPVTGMVLVTAQGMNALTPGGAGTLTLVSVGKTVVGLPRFSAVVSTLTLNYVPEPGTLVLLGL